MAGDRCSTVVKVLRYKSEGRWFDPRWCRGIIHWQKSFWSQYGPGVDSASNRNEFQEYFLGVNAAGAKADNLTTILCRRQEIWEP
jgi:spore maturation protein CgeB